MNNLGVYLDSELVRNQSFIFYFMDRQVSKLCGLLLSPAPVVNSASIAHQGIATHVSRRLCYDSGRLLQWSSVQFLFDRLQFVLNSAARLVLNIPKFSSISAAIRDELHWLPIRRRIDFKIALMIQDCLVGAAPDYLMELCHPVGSAVGRQCLRLQTFGHRPFAVSQIWNSLPLRIRQSHNNFCFSNRN